MKRADIAIESRAGVTIYGRVIDKLGRLGQFEVHSDRLGNNGSVYTLYSEAEARMKALIGVEEGKSEDNGNQRNTRNGRYKGR